MYFIVASFMNYKRLIFCKTRSFCFWIDRECNCVSTLWVKTVHRGKYVVNIMNLTQCLLSSMTYDLIYLNRRSVNDIRKISSIGYIITNIWHTQLKPVLLTILIIINNYIYSIVMNIVIIHNYRINNSFYLFVCTLWIIFEDHLALLKSFEKI